MIKIIPQFFLRVIQEKLKKEVKETNDEIVTRKKHFKVFSWNIDGLDLLNLESRTKGVINVIAKYSKIKL